MSSLFSRLAVVLVAGALGFACAPIQRTVMRSEMRLVNAKPITKEGVTIKARVLGIQDLAKNPRFNRKVAVTQVDPLGRAQRQSQVAWTLIGAPAFELKITNNTGHVLRMSGTVIKLVDAGGNTYDVITRDLAAAKMNEAMTKFQAPRPNGWRYRVDPSAHATLSSAMAQIKMLTENAQILPNFTETYMLSFALPIEETEAAYNQWFSRQTSLTLKIYEVPAEVDVAGRPTKKVHFEVPVRIETYRELWEGRKLKRSERM